MIVLCMCISCNRTSNNDVASSKIGDIATGPLKVCPSNPRYFTDGSGKVIYLTGSHTWRNFKDMGSTDSPTPFDFDDYLDFLKRHNHNFVRLWTCELTKYQYKNLPLRDATPFPWRRTGPGMALDGKPKFDLRKFDQTFFDRLRSRVLDAGERGIYVSIMLFEGHGLFYSERPWCWNGHPFNINNNINGIDGDPNNDEKGLESHTLEIRGLVKIQEDYVRKVIDSVNDLDNVLYEISNEDHIDSVEWQYHMVNLIHNYEKTKPKQHPVGMTTHVAMGNKVIFKSPADWVSPSVLKRSDENDAYKVDPPATDGRKVSILDSDHIGIYRDHGAEFQRSWVWKAFTRGHQPIFMDPYLQYREGRNYPKDGNTDPFYDPIRKSMGYTLVYANKMDLSAATPRGDLSSTEYCLANPGSEYLIYKPMSLNPLKFIFTANLKAGTYKYEWFNPRRGAVVSTGSITVADGNKFFIPPFIFSDAVLYIYK
jgi:hypothetical protein